MKRLNLKQILASIITLSMIISLLMPSGTSASNYDHYQEQYDSMQEERQKTEEEQRNSEKKREEAMPESPREGPKNGGASDNLRATPLSLNLVVSELELPSTFELNKIATIRASSTTAILGDLSSSVIMFSQVGYKLIIKLDGEPIFEQVKSDKKEEFNYNPSSGINHSAEFTYTPVKKGVYTFEVQAQTSVFPLATLTTISSALVTRYTSDNPSRPVGPDPEEPGPEVPTTPLTVVAQPTNPTYGEPFDLIMSGGSGTITDINIGGLTMDHTKLAASGESTWILPRVTVPGRVGQTTVNVTRGGEVYTSSISIKAKQLMLNLQAVQEFDGSVVIKSVLTGSGVDFVKAPITGGSINLSIQSSLARNAVAETLTVNSNGTIAPYSWMPGPGVYNIQATFVDTNGCYQADPYSIASYDIAKKFQGILKLNLPVSVGWGETFMFEVEGGKSDTQLAIQALTGTGQMEVLSIQKESTGVWKVKAKATKAGFVNVLATMPADSTYNEVSVKGGFYVIPQEMEIRLAVSPSPTSKAGKEATLTATFKDASGKVLPDGNVIFEAWQRDGKKKWSKRVVVSNGKAETNWLPAESGTYELVAYYDLNAAENYYATNRATKAHTVEKSTQKALTFSTIPANPVYGTPFDLVIQGESGGGAITFIEVNGNALNLSNLIAESGNRWVLPNVALPGIIGTAQVKATRAADGQYKAKTSEETIAIAARKVALNLNVEQGGNGDRFIQGSLSGGDFTTFPVATGSKVKLVVKHLETGNKKIFIQDVHSNGTMATHAWTTTPGTYEITGTFTMPAEHTYYRAEAAVVQGYDVTKQSQGALKFVFPTPIVVGSDFTFYVQEAKSEGQLKLLVANESALQINKIDRKANGTWEVSAKALKARTFKITATQPSDATYNESSVEEMLTILPLEMELLLSVSSASSKVGEAITLTTTFQANSAPINPEGDVIFEVWDKVGKVETLSGTIANGKAERTWVPVASGDYIIVATYDHETAKDYRAVGPVSATHTVERQIQSDLTFSTNPANLTYGTPFDLHITGDADGGDKLTSIFVGGVEMDATKATKNGANAWILPGVVLKDQVGTISVTATRIGNTQFAAKTTDGNIQVLPKALSLNLATKKEENGTVSISGYLTGADFGTYPIPGASKVQLSIKKQGTSEDISVDQSVYANGQMVAYTWNATPGIYEITGTFTTPADKAYYKEATTTIAAYDVEKNDQELTFTFPNAIVAGETFQFTVSGANSKGDLELQMDPAYLKEMNKQRVGDVWTIEMKALKAGDVQIKATQPGDGTYNAASVEQTISIVKKSMRIALAISPTPSSKAQEEVTFTATFRDGNGSIEPDGTVIFEVWKKNGKQEKELTQDVSNGRAVVNYTPAKSGDYTIVARYDNTSSEQYSVSRSASTDHNVGKHTQEALTFTTSPVEPLYGDTFDLRIQGAAGGGEISSVTINGVARDLTNLVSAGANAWILPISGVKGKVGTIKVEATRSGDDQYKKVTSTGSITVAAKEVSLNLATTPMVDGKITISGRLTGANFAKFQVPADSTVALTIKKTNPNGDSVTETLGVYPDGAMVDYTWEPMPGVYELTATYTDAKRLYTADKVVIPAYDVAKKPQDALRFRITEPIIMGSEFTFQVSGGTNHSMEELQLELEEGNEFLTIQSIQKCPNSFVWDVKAKAEKAGAVRLLATLPGDEEYNDIWVSDYLTIHPREMDLVFAVAPGNSKLNEQVTLTATFEDQGSTLTPDGKVIFEVHEKNGGLVYEETVAISNGQARLNWLAKEVGNYTLIARYDQAQSTDYKVRNQGEVDHRVLKQTLGVNRLTVTPNEGLIAKETLTVTWEALALLKTNKMLPAGVVEFIAHNVDTNAEYKQEVRFQTNPLDVESVLATWEIPNIKKGNYVISAKMLENNAFRASDVVYLNSGAAYEVQGAKQDPLLVTVDQDTLTYGKEFNFQISGGSGDGALSTFDVIRGFSILDLDLNEAERHFDRPGIDWTMKALPRDVGEAEVSVTKAGDDYYDDITVTKKVTIGATELNLDVTVRPEMSTTESAAKKDVVLEGALTGFNPDAAFAPTGTITLSITSLNRLEDIKTKEIQVDADGTIEPWEWKMLQTGFYKITGQYTDDTGHYVAKMAEIKPYTVNAAEQEPLTITTKPEQVKNNKVKVGQTFDILISGGSGEGAVSSVEATVGAHLVEIGAIKKLPAKTRADAPTWQVSVTTYEAGDITIKAIKAEDAFHNPVEATIDLTIASRNGKLNLDVNPKDNLLVGDNVTFSTKMEDVTDVLTKPALSNNVVSPNGIGAIAFEVINQSTGKVMWYRIVEVTLSGETLCGWTPSEAGSYTVKAIYLTDKTKQYNAIPEETIHITVKAKAGEGSKGSTDGTGGSGTGGSGYSGSGGGSGSPKTGDYTSTMTILTLMACAGAVLIVLEKKKQYRKK